MTKLGYGWISAILLFCASVCQLACTDTSLYDAEDNAPVLEPMQISIEVCAPKSVVRVVAYKILFVIDTSYSNCWNDPGLPSCGPPNEQPRRERAVRNAISEQLQNENVRFGVITYSDQPRRQTFGFTRETHVLNGAAANIATAQGGTNYSDTIWAMNDFIMADLNQLAPAEAGKTHYLVFWVSDGIPTVGVVDTDALLPGVTHLRDSLVGRVAEFRLNTAFVGAVSPTTDEEADGARALLASMSEAGNGTFANYEAGETLAFVIDPRPEIYPFEFAAMVANNRNTRFGSEHPLPDSDGDGLSDDEELELGLDPRLADTDGDGYGDGLELLLRAYLLPDRWDDGCQSRDLDTDGDGLLDCEEALLGTNVQNVDSDGDFLLDSIEALAGSSALSNDPNADRDIDGVSDVAEVMGHLDPRVPTTEADVQRWSYVYDKADLNTSGDGPPCYSLSIDNIKLYETLDTDSHDRGDQTIEMVVAFKTPAGPELNRFLKAEKEVRCILPDLQGPAGGLDFTTDDFVEMPGVHIDSLSDPP